MENTSAQQSATDQRSEINRKLLAWQDFGEKVLAAWTSLASISKVAIVSTDNYARRLFVRQAVENAIRHLQDGVHALMKGYPQDIITDRQNITPLQLLNPPAQADNRKSFDDGGGI